MLNRGEFVIIMGALEYGGLSDDPVTECYDMADSLYEPGREMTLWVYYDAWNDGEFARLPYAGPANKGEIK